jgi:hypothetical protein
LRDASGHSFSISKPDLQRLKKTSIDFTLCDASTRPLICIEYDGLEEGYNHGTSYCSSAHTPDPWREQITELKLRVAHGSGFPYFVVGSHHFGELSIGVKLTIVDGIIGCVFSSLEFGKTLRDLRNGNFPSGIGLCPSDFEALSSGSQDAIIDDYVIGKEIEADLRNNPIAAKAAEYAWQTRGLNWSSEFPPFPNYRRPMSQTEWDREVKNCHMDGARIVVKLPDGGSIPVEVWLPQFNSPNYHGLGLVEWIAKLIAFQKASRWMKLNGALPTG